MFKINWIIAAVFTYSTRIAVVMIFPKIANDLQDAILRPVLCSHKRQTLYCVCVPFLLFQSKQSSASQTLAPPLLSYHQFRPWLQLQLKQGVRIKRRWISWCWTANLDWEAFKLIWWTQPAQHPVLAVRCWLDLADRGGLMYRSCLGRQWPPP